MNIDDKKQYIYDKINNLEFNTIYIRDYIINSNIKYTENNNGIFVNLNTIYDNDINNIYDIILNKINYNNMIIDNEYQINTEIFNNSKIEIIKKKYDSFDDLNFTEIELEIIKLSQNK
jgi:hypothetical protein